MKQKAFLVRNIAPDAFGGGEVYQLMLAEKLKTAGIEPYILTNSTELIRKAKAQGTKVLIPPYSKRQNWSGIWNLCLPFYCLYQFKLKRWYKSAFEKYNPSVVNIQSRDDYLAATRVAHRLGIKILWTDHADFVNWVFNNVNVRFKNVIGKKIIKCSKYANRIIFVSKCVKDQTERLIYPRRMNNTIVIPNGAEDRFEAYKDVVEKDNSFVYIGRIVREKGLEELLEAFKIVKKKYNSASLSIYGGGEWEEFEKKVIEGVKFYGETNEPLLAMAENEAFVLPSYAEGLPLALIEAAMMQKTIIATNVGGMSEVIENNETGILVAPRNVKQLSDAMLEVLEDKKTARKMARDARKVYAEKFDFDAIFRNQILRLYIDD